MAEGLINHFLKDKWKAYSGGVNHESRVNPWAVRIMKEIGIDISSHYPKSVEEFIDRNDLDLVITVCDHAKETCPVFPGNVKQVHMGFEDPAPYSNDPEPLALNKYREIRDLIKDKLLEYLRAYY